MERQETTQPSGAKASPPRRGLSWATFKTLPGITPKIIGDMAHVLHGDGYGNVTPATRAFMRQHNVAWVSLYGEDWELGR
jgi:hypothetical protein